MRPVLPATACTIEYDTVMGAEHGALRGAHAIALLPFPNPDEDAGLLLAGTIADLRAAVDAMGGLLDDLEADGA